jgi:hypothetical protein
MYFSTCDHYLCDAEDLHNTDDTDTLENMNEANHIVEYNICFVCLEIKDPYQNEYCITLHNNLYIKICTCNGWIHKRCLNIWYNQNKQCPVCLCKMIQKMETRDVTCISIYSKINKIFKIICVNIVYIRLLFSFLSLVWFYYHFIFFLAFLIKNIRVRPTYYN